MPLFTGPSNTAWRTLSCEILRTYADLGLDRFYRNLFKVWTLFKTDLQPLYSGF